MAQNTFKCEYCERTFDKKKSMTNHRRWHNEEFKKNFKYKRPSMTGVNNPSKRFEVRKKIKENHWTITKPNTINKTIEAMKNKYANGYVSPMKGFKHSEETKRKMSKAKKGVFSLSKHPHWKGGKSFEFYPGEFNTKLKEQIRKRDNYTCQECNFTEEQLSYTLSVHHIDYNKKNNNPNNLISLCRSCHSQTNFGRDDWSEYFNNKIIGVNT